MQKQIKESDFCIISYDAFPYDPNEYPGEITKEEQLQYIESLLAPLAGLARQSGETFLSHILNMALLETRDRQRALEHTGQS